VSLIGGLIRKITIFSFLVTWEKSHCKKLLIEQKKALAKIIFGSILSRKLSHSKSVDLSNEEARCVAMHIAYESILAKSIQNENVDFLLCVVFLAGDEFAGLVFL